MATSIQPEECSAKLAQSLSPPPLLYLIYSFNPQSDAKLTPALKIASFIFKMWSCGSVRFALEASNVDFNKLKALITTSWGEKFF